MSARGGWKHGSGGCAAMPPLLLSGRAVTAPLWTQLSVRKVRLNYWYGNAHKSSQWPAEPGTYAVYEITLIKVIEFAADKMKLWSRRRLAFSQKDGSG